MHDLLRTTSSPHHGVHLLLGCLLVLLALGLAACGDGLTEADETIPETTPSASLDALFDAAAAEFDVPAALLKAISYTETQWQMVEGHEEFEGMPPAFGLMALRGARLDEGARLAGVTVEAVRTEPAANIRAAAALLSRWADETGLDRADLSAWAPLAARYSGIEASEGQAEYVHHYVYDAIRTGVMARTEGGAVIASILPQAITPAFAAPPASKTASADYGPAIWRPSPNYNSRPSGSIGDVGMVIIHTCEGSYSGCWSWLTNAAAGASAHYVVNSTGTEISQLVRESQRAWHIGATYSCSRNSNVDCWRNGYSSNHFTVGIEHAGYASQSSFNTGMIQASAELSCHLSQRYNIPRDRYHYVAHGQLQPWNRTDPGPNWPWTDYLNRINAACGTGGGGGGGTIVVDSNNGLNDTNKGYIQVSSNWTASSHSTDYNTGYWWAGTQAVSDGATFWFYLPSGGQRTIDAWWVSGSNRAPSAPFLVYNASGTKLATVYKDQRSNGGKWNTLGTWTFTAGWNRVVLSRWTTSGNVVIADAVRIR